jgi:hypothetical protein
MNQLLLVLWCPRLGLRDAFRRFEIESFFVLPEKMFLISAFSSCRCNRFLHFPLLRSTIYSFVSRSYTTAGKSQKRTPWTEEHKQLLFNYTANKPSIRDSEWKELSKTLRRSPDAIKKYYNLNWEVLVGRRMGKWNPLEDRKLLEAVDRVGSEDFVSVAFFVPHRTALQCSMRLTRLQAKDKYSTGRRWTKEETEKLENCLFKFLIRRC